MFYLFFSHIYWFGHIGIMNWCWLIAGFDGKGKNSSKINVRPIHRYHSNNTFLPISFDRTILTFCNNLDTFISFVMGGSMKFLRRIPFYHLNCSYILEMHSLNNLINKASEKKSLLSVFLGKSLYVTFSLHHLVTVRFMANSWASHGRIMP